MRRFLAKTYKLLSVLLFVAAILLLPKLVGSAPAPETWGDFVNEPDISYGELRTAQAHLENSAINRDVFGGMECTEEAFPIAVVGEMTECWYETGVGRTTKGGPVFVPSGADKAGFMKDFATYIFPTRNQNVLLETSTEYDQAWIRKGASIDATLVEDPEGNMPNFWTWDNAANLNLSPFNGDYLYAQAAYSNNNRWLLFFDTTGYLVRIDLQNLTISTYRVPITDENGYYWAATAISDSGRYIATYEYGYDFLVIDTEGCTELKDHIEIPSSEVTCTTRSIMDYAREYYEDLASLYPEFYGDDVLRVRGINTDGEGDEIVLQAPNTHKGTNYIALGDSYSSGEGAYNYLPGTDDPNNRCHTSSRSYPFLLGNWLRLDSAHSVACSGGKINNIALGHPNDAPQNTKLPSDQSLGKWLPGYKWQIEHVKDPNNPVDIVTVGIGGNDIGFKDKLTECAAKPSKCFMSTYDRVGISLEISYQFDRLAALYSGLRSQALKRSPTARMYAVGYPQVFDATGSYTGLCGNNVRMSYEEVLLASNLITYLNSTIRSAAARAGVVYVSLEGALGDYMLCGTGSSRGVNGLSAGNGALKFYSGPIAIESYHPSYFGHTLIAEAIRRKTNDFNLPIPAPNRFITAPDVLRNELVGNAVDMPGTIRRFVYGGDVSSDHVVKGSDYYLFLGGKYNLAVGTKVVATFHSEPTLIGEYMVDQDGTVKAYYSVPDSLDPGLHTIHVYGETVSGEKVDIYKSVYVALSEEDWDGDGIPNSSEPCGIIDPLGFDEDNDNIDDGCDSEITSSNILNSGVGFAGIEGVTSNRLGLASNNETAETYRLLTEQRVDEGASNTSFSAPKKPRILLVSLFCLGIFVIYKLLKNKKTY